LAAMAVVVEGVVAVPVWGESSLNVCELDVEQAAVAAAAAAAAHGPRNSHRSRSYLRRSAQWVLQVTRTSVGEEHEWRSAVHVRKVAVAVVAL
jgi:hypothetical protein